MQETCPCGSKNLYSECCGRFITGKALPATPLELMRSRYTAYTKKDLDYITRTMKPPALSRFDTEQAKSWIESIEWIKLEIIATSEEGNKGYVEFLAHFFQNKRRHVMHEFSEFHLINNQWFYVDGKEPRDVKSPVRTQKISRNDSCTCGSGKKYKKCCGLI